MNATIMIGIVAAGFIIYQQFQARPLNPRLLFGVPVALTLWGAGSLGHQTDTTSIAFFTINAAVAVGLGIWRGTSIRVWTEGGRAFQQCTLATLGLWLLSVGVRLALVGAGHLAYLSSAANMMELPLLLGLTLGAQNLVIWVRSASPAPTFARSL